MTSDTETSLGGRVRKTTQKFTFSATEEEEFSAPKGRGVKVRDMAFVKGNVEALGKTHHEMIKQLYHAMFGRRYQQKNMKEIKTHLLDFSGIIEQDEKSREHLYDKLNKWKVTFVNEVMDLLAVDRSKKGGETNDKKTLINRLIDWLYNPQETEVGQKKAALAAKKEKAKANKRAKAKAAAEKKANAKDKGPAKKKRKTAKKKAGASEDDDEEDDHENTESEGEESSSDFEESKKPTKKRKATRRPKKSRVVESDNEEDEDEDVKENEDKGEKEEASTEKDKEHPAAEPEAEAETNIAKKEPTTEPLAADVCDKVRDIIAHGNAEELTVKKIVRQLSADLGRDMSSQKKAIKEFITNDQAEI